MSSRGKRLIALALNAELQKKIPVFKNKNKEVPRSGDDPDYLPPDNNTDGLSTSCSSSDSENYEHTVAEKENVIDNVEDKALRQSKNSDATAPPAQTEEPVRDGIIDEEYQDENKNEALELDYEWMKRIVLATIINNVVDTKDKLERSMYTKKGLPRKRKTLDVPLAERKRQKLQDRKELHTVKPPCTKCSKKCPDKIDPIRQADINIQFWNTDNGIEQKAFVSNCIKKCMKQRKTTTRENSRRENSFKYVLKNVDGIEVSVCKTFLLATLGFAASNDSILKSVRNTDSGTIMPKKDMRGHHPNKAKIDRNVIIDHIKTFNPVISHYRREHAPNKLYLPSDVSVTLMYQDFKSKNPNLKFSYELYRKEVVAMNISFAQLGNEEFFVCEKFDLHSKTSNHQKTELMKDCGSCEAWESHKEKYDAARKEYQRDAKQIVPERLVVSVDLQKVIMLPRAEMFKDIIFIPRVIVFNESFVPAGEYSKSVKPLAVIWHEGTAGRKKADLVSTFYAFFEHNRDQTNITIWLDNCAAQNKNWALFCFFVYAVNCTEFALTQLEVKYFQSGHTFMSADSFHHQVELSLKRMAKVYDFNDFKSAVQNANSSRVDVKEMQIHNLFDWQDFTSKYKVQKLSPRPYLHDMTHLSFKRGENVLYYKNNFIDEFIKLNFLTAKHHKEGIPKPPFRIKCRGICGQRKNNLIAKLRQIVSESRLKFWEEIEVCDHNLDINDENGE